MLSKAIMHPPIFGEIFSLGSCAAPDPMIPAIASYKCASMQFTVGYSMEEFLYIADQVGKGHRDSRPIITKEIPLLELPAMFARCAGPITGPGFAFEHDNEGAPG